MSSSQPLGESSSEPPVISFLMTVHGTESYLPAAVASVLAQTVPGWELVMVDNGRSDAVLEAMQRYTSDARIRLVRQENRGYAGGVTAAAAAASGGVFTVLDSDDLVMPTFVETMTGLLKDHAEIDAVGCDAHLFLDGDDRAYTSYFRSIGRKGPRGTGRQLLLRDVLRGTVPFYAGAVRRRAWEECGGYAAAASDVEEDVLLWLRLAASNRVWLLPDRLARCRVRRDSLSRNPSRIDDFEQRLINTFHSFAEASPTAEARKQVQFPVRRIAHHRSLRRARDALRAGDVDAARHHAVEAFRERATLRAGLVVASLRLAPRALATVHPLKQRAGEVRRRTTARLRSQGP